MHSRLARALGPSGNRSVSGLPSRPRTGLFTCPRCVLRTFIATIHDTPRGAGRQKAARAVGTIPREGARSHGKKISHRFYATYLASSTAINAPQNIPEENKELYQSLQALQHIAGDYINQSRLQLALRGLENSEPIVRIGILGLGGSGAPLASKLARILLADPLGQREPWEDQLAGDAFSSRPAILIKYGEEGSLAGNDPLLETVHIPSRVLEKNNLEILISSINLETGPTSDIGETILVPPLQTPIAATGRTGYVRYPVHKALLVGEGIQGCVAVGRLAEAIREHSQESLPAGLVSTAVDLPGGRSNAKDVQLIDVDEAAQGVDVFRRDVSNGPQFSSKWQSSGIAALSQWLTAHDGKTMPDIDAATVGGQAVLRSLIRSLLETVRSKVTIAEAAAASAIAQRTIPWETRSKFQIAISDWSQQAHSDLQLSLERALASKSWRRTSWYKLLWRVDDVGVSAEDVLRSHWLLEAESGLAYLAGRIEGAGFFSTGSSPSTVYNPDHAYGQSLARETTQMPILEDNTANLVKSNEDGKSSVSASNAAVAITAEPTFVELMRSDQVLGSTEAQGGIDMTKARPWPLAIDYTRQKLLCTLVPSLQTRAQALVLQTLTPIGATSALGAWIYVATMGADILSAGAVASLGLVLSLRRLQSKWQVEKEAFESEIRESGRVVLADVENLVRDVVKDNERPQLRQEDIANWEKTREALRRCEEELEKMAK